MLKFSNLTLAQQRFVVAAIESNKGYTTNPQITLKECSALYDAVRATRTGSKGEKIGYPNWLFANNKVERGVYQLPVPTAAELSKYQQELDAKLNPIKKAKAKVAKLQAVKTSKTAAPKATRLETVISESQPVDTDIEDFNAILRENGIEV